MAAVVEVARRKKSCLSNQPAVRLLGPSPCSRNGIDERLLATLMPKRRDVRLGMSTGIRRESIPAMFHGAAIGAVLDEGEKQGAVVIDEMILDAVQNGR